ncbi:MAG: MASE1 domain-containing protein [Myxococcota bacterium]
MFFLVFMALTQVGYLFAFQPYTGIGVFWPSAGFCLAVLLLEDFRAWPAYVAAIFVGEFVGVTLQGHPVPVSLLWSVAASGEPLLAAWVLRRVMGSPFTVGSIKDLVALVAVGAIVSPCLAGALAATGAVWGLGAPSWSMSWITWWFGDALGVVVVTPFLLVWLARGQPRPRAREVLVGVLLMGLVALSAQALFGANPVGGVLWIVPGFLTFPLMLWAAVRFELRGVTTAAAILNILAAYHTTRGRGMFAELGGTPLDRLIALQAYLSAVTLSSVTLAAALGERRRGERQLQDMIDNASAVIFAKRTDGRYLFVNRAFERITGTCRKDVVGRTAHQLWSAPYADATADADLEVLQTGQSRVSEEEIPTQTGHRTYAGVRFPLIAEHGAPYAVCGMATDITERKRAEEALQRSEERLRYVVAATHDAIYDLDVLTGTVWRNERYEVLFGPTAGPDVWMARIHPDDRARVLASLRAASDAHARTWAEEYRFTRPDGSYARVLDNAYLLYGPDGEQIRMIGALADVTERREAQAALELANRELEQRVERRTAELAAAFEQMESFSYSISHDLRGPLRAINGFGKALEEELAHLGSRDANEYLARIRAASRHMGELIDDLLTLSRAGRAEVRHEAVNLGSIVSTVVQELRDGEPERIVTVNVEPGLIVCGDPGLLRIVLQNLLANAWKFTSQHPTARIDIGRLELGEETAYFVRDDGAGFDERYSGKLFRPFERLHRTTEFPGTGIGLATTHRIIARHGGRVWAKGAVEAGATFYFTVPDGEAGVCGPATARSVSKD